MLLEAYQRAAAVHALLPPNDDDKAEIRRRDRIKAEFVGELAPLIRNCLNDAFALTRLERTDDWLWEVHSAGCLVVVKKLSELLERKLETEKHIHNCLRKPLKKAMFRTLWKLHSVPTPSYETRKRRQKRNQPEFRPWELRGAGEAFPDEEVYVRGRQPHLDNRFLARDHSLADRYSKFLEMVRDEAMERAQGSLWAACLAAMQKSDDLHTAEGRPIILQIARLVEMPRRTLQKELTRLGEEIAAEASPELRELGEEFLGFVWEKAARNGFARHRNYRGTARDRSADAA